MSPTAMSPTAMSPTAMSPTAMSPTAIPPAAGNRRTGGPTAARPARLARLSHLAHLAHPGSAEPTRRPPVDGAVVRPFQAPAHEYGAGHRGVDLSVAPGAAVSSPAAGVVTFAGPVAGRGVVVVRHASGTLSSFEPAVATVAVATVVRAGATVAVVADVPAHAGCPGRCLHWGVRVEGRYVDPLWWLGGDRTVRLLPLGGPR